MGPLVFFAKIISKLVVSKTGGDVTCMDGDLLNEDGICGTGRNWKWTDLFSSVIKNVHLVLVLQRKWEAVFALALRRRLSVLTWVRVGEWKGVLEMLLGNLFS